MKAHAPTRFVVSVLVADRVGILRDITAALSDLGANMDGISQTVIEGYFTVILTATFDQPMASEPIRQAIQRNFHGHEASVVVREFDPRAVRHPPVKGDRYVVTMSGEDRKGILKTTMAYLAEKGINVEDWYVHFEGTRVTQVGEVTVPEILDVQQIQREFQQRLQELGMRVSIQHENIFRVTNEVGAVRPLLKR
jgi:predicted amino acid-binding ACT domain protein